MKKQTRARSWFFGVLILSLILFFSRSYLAKVAFMAIAGYGFSGSEITYQSIDWNKEGICLEGLQIRSPDYDAEIKSLKINCNLTFSPFCLEPSVFAIEPALTLHEPSESSAFLFPMLVKKHLTIRVDVQDGICYFPGEYGPLYFSSKKGNTTEEVAKISLSSKKESPEISLDVKREEEGVQVLVQMLPVPFEEIFSRVNFFFPGLKKTDAPEGSLSLSGQLALNFEGKIEQLHTQAEFSNLCLDHPELGFYIEAEKGYFAYSYPSHENAKELPFWKRFLMSFSLDKGHVLLTKNQVGMQNLQVSMDSFGEEEPRFCLQGDLRIGENLASAKLEGQGGVEETGAFWLQGDLSLEDQNVLLSRLKLTSSGKQNYSLEGDLKNFASDHFAILKSLIPKEVFSNDCGMADGFIDAKIHAIFQERNLVSFELDEVQGKNIHFQFLEKRGDLVFPSFESEIKFIRTDDHYQIETLDFVAEGGYLAFDGHHFEESHLNLHIREGKWEPSVYETQFLGNQVLCYGEGDIDEGNLLVKLSGPVMDILTPFSPSLAKRYQNLEFKECAMNFEFSSESVNGEVVLVDSQLKKESFHLEIAKESPFSIKEVGFSSKNITGAFLTPVLLEIDSRLTLEGNFLCKGSWGQKGLQISIGGENSLLKRELYRLEFSNSSNPIQISFSKEKNWQVNFPIRNAKYHDEHLSVESLDADMHLEAGQASTFDLHILNAEMILTPSLRLSNLQTQLSFKDKILLTQGLLATVQLGEKRYTLHANPFYYRDGKGDFDVQCLATTAEMFHLTGEFTIGDKISVQLTKGSHFLGMPIKSEVSWKNGKLYALEVESTLHLEKTKDLMDVLKEANLLSENPIQTPLEGEVISKWQYSKNTLAVEAKGSALIFGGEAFNQLYFSLEKKQDRFVIQKLELDKYTLEAKGSYQNNTIVLDSWFLQSEDARAKGKASIDWNEKYAFIEASSIDVKLAENISLLANATFETDLTTEGYGEIGIKMKKDKLALRSKEKMQFTYSKAKGFEIGDSMLVLEAQDRTLAMFHSEKVLIQTKERTSVVIPHLEFSFSSLCFRISPEVKEFERYVQLHPYLQGEASIHFENSGRWKCKGKLDDDSFDLNLENKVGVPISLKGIAWECGPNSLKAGMKLIYDKLLLDASVEAKNSENPSVIVSLMQDEQLIAAQFLKKDGKIDCEFIKGTLLGITADLKGKSFATEKTLEGKVALDIDKMAILLPKDAYKQCKKLGLTNGYSLKGDFSFLPEKSMFSGILSADRFDLLGYRFDHFTSVIRIDKNKLSLRDIALNDKAGNLVIKDAVINREDKGWLFYAPLVKIQQFQPSLMEKKHEKREEKPFTIRNAHLIDLRGRLDEISSFTALGKANFTNRSKNENPAFASELLKNLGLDPQIFVPIAGECSYRLQEGKLYIDQLSDTFSEGRRSQFYLVDGTSYIDLDGNLSLDVRMKQNVVVKLTEPFVVKVRGTIKQPKFSLDSPKK